MGLKFEQVDRVRSRSEVILDTPENRHKKYKMMRKQAFRRVGFNAISMCGIILLLYCCSLYIGAYVDVGGIIGDSQSVRSQKTKSSVDQMHRTKKGTIISPITNRIAIDRLYMRRGQSILATYSLPENSTLNLIITQCKKAPFIEIFKCQTVGEQSKSINNETTGFLEFTAARSGFHRFESNIAKPSGSKLKVNYDYSVVWQRSGKQAR